LPPTPQYAASSTALASASVQQQHQRRHRHQHACGGSHSNANSPRRALKCSSLAQAALPEFALCAPAPVSGSCVGVSFWCALAPELFAVRRPLNARRRASHAIRRQTPLQPTSLPTLPAMPLVAPLASAASNDASPPPSTSGCVSANLGRDRYCPHRCHWHRHRQRRRIAIAIAQRASPSPCWHRRRHRQRSPQVRTLASLQQQHQLARRISLIPQHFNHSSSSKISAPTTATTAFQHASTPAANNNSTRTASAAHR